MKLIKSFLYLIFMSSTVAYALPTTKLTLRVIDESGQPIGNAKVGMGLSKPKAKGWGIEEIGYDGATDTGGLFTAQGATEPYIGFGVNKEGYYETTGHFRDFTGVSGIIGFRKWQPWNPTVEVVLKKIINPIPLYVAKVGTHFKPLEVPENNKFMGYDLIARDWVVPHGQGLHSDFLFKSELFHMKPNTHE